LAENSNQGGTFKGQFFVGIFCPFTKKMWVNDNSDKNTMPCICLQQRLSDIYVICRCPIACPMKMLVNCNSELSVL